MSESESEGRMAIEGAGQELGAGRELDLRVAAMMGDTQDEEGWWVAGDGSRISTCDGGPRFYSSEIAAAWKVRAEMKRQGFHFGYYDDLHKRGDCRNSAEFWHEDGRSASAHGDGEDDAALAICRAAIAALEPRS
jgi:hypothetical protein